MYIKCCDENDKFHYLIKMKVVCSNYHGVFSFPQDNVQFQDLITFGHKFYKHRPHMIKYQKDGITLLIFTSLRFRVMGKGESHIQVLEDFLRSLPWRSQFSSLTNSMTITHQLPLDHINLNKLNKKYFQLELELFPAAKLLHSGREHMNVFHSGKIIILGARDVNSVSSSVAPICLKMWGGYLFPM